MRLWLVNPQVLCMHHLLGEHRECHMIVGRIVKGLSVATWANRGLINTSVVKRRHDELAREIERRGYKHKSPLQYEDTLNLGVVNVKEALTLLQDRCSECRRRMRMLITEELSQEEVRE